MSLKQLINRIRWQAGYYRHLLRSTRSSHEPADVPSCAVLEERILMSATPLAVAAPEVAAAAGASADGASNADYALENHLAAGDFATQSSSTAENATGAEFAATQTASLEVVVVDESIDDVDQLLADLQRQSDGRRRFEVFQLESDRDGVEQISEIVSRFDQIDALHIVTHGTDGAVRLGNLWLTSNNLSGYAGEFASWGRAMSADADVLFYGCELAQSAAGRELMQSIAVVTGADVAASDDNTGHAIFGGDWDLEYHVGSIETDVAFSVMAQQEWLGLLNVNVESTTTGTAGNGASSVVVSHTTSGNANRLMLVGVSFGEDKGDRVTSVTYGGQSMTLVGARDHSDSSQSRVEIWGLVAPNSGTANVTVNIGPGPIEHQGVTVGVTTFSNVDQFDAWGTFASATGDSSNASVTVASAPTEVVFGVAALSNSSNQNWTPGAGQTERWDLFNSKANGTGTTEAGAASVTTSFSSSPGAGKWVAAGVSVQKLTAVVDTAADYDSGSGNWGDTSSIENLIANKGADNRINLREAITAANNTAGTDRINFDIAGAGPHVITLTKELPNITETVFINGSGDPDGIVIDVANLGKDGLVLDSGSDGSTIDGLNIRNAGAASAIRILSNNNTLTNNYLGTDATGNSATAATDNDYGVWIEGGTGNTIGSGNVIGGNNVAGVYLKNAGNTTIAGSHIGIGADGSSIVANADGIWFDGTSGATVGGTATADRNVISGNTTGIRIDGGSASNTISGNYIGTDAAGLLDRGNTGDGIWIANASNNNTIGGSTTNHRNVIAGNDDDGIQIGGSSGTEVYNNYIGVNRNGNTALANGDDGVFVTDSGGTIIGAATDGNVIGGNTGNGIHVSGAGSTGTLIRSNYLGTNSSGDSLGNLRGIWFSDDDDAGGSIGDPMGATVGGTSSNLANTIAFNVQDGVKIENGTDIAVLGNSIHSNTQQGIDLAADGITANDTGVQDADTGPNNLQNFPTISSAVATVNGNSVDITFSLDSEASTTYRIEFFENQNAEANGEGLQFLGSTSVTTDASGLVTNQVVTISGYGSNLVNLDYITATATVDDAGTFKSTSEFGGNHVVQFVPGIAVNGTRNFVEDSGAVTLDTTVTVTDLDSPHFSGGSLTVDIDDANGTANDRLIIADEGASANQIHLTGPNNIHFNGDATPFATYSGGTSDTDPLIITFSNNLATQAAVQRLAERIQFDNVSNTPSEAQRTVTFVLNDGTFNSVSDSVAVNVTKNNDAPTGSVSISGTPTEDQILTASNTLNDADGMGVVTYQWQRNGGNIAGATSATYTLDDADAAQNIRVRASYTDGEGNAHQVFSSTVGPITNVNDAPVLDNTQNLTFAQVANAPGGVNDDGDSVLDLLLSGGSGNPITDVDPSAVAGIAINQIDDSNGTWQYSTDGGTNWNDIDPDGPGATVISNANALLLQADGGGQNRVRFVADAGFTGTVSNFRFRAWDTTESPVIGNAGYADIDTLGTGGATAFSTAQETASITVVNPFVLDQFNAVSYSGNDGTHNWTGDWIETDNASANSGDIRVLGSNELRVRSNTVGEQIVREVDLSGATSATLTFQSTNNLLTTGQIDLEISSDGGAGWTTLKSYTLLNGGSTSESFNITSHIAANTQIRFRVAAVLTGSTLIVDDVRIDYTLPAANTNPVITSDGGGAGAAVNVAENSTAVTTVVANDTDVPAQTLTYSIVGGADAARFAVNGSSGALTFVAAPDFEAPTDTNTDNIYHVTVQVSDGAGGTDTQNISVTVTDLAAAELWLTSSGDVVSPSGAPGLDSWTAGEVLKLGGPTLSLDPDGTPANTTAGQFSSVFNLDSLVQDSDARLNAIHYVGSNITVGGGANTFNLNAGDVLFSTQDAETLQSTNSLAVTGLDLVVFRPDVAGNYGSGTFTLLLDAAQIPELTIGLHGISLVESATTVGDSVLAAGSFLVTTAGDANIFHYTADGVGAGTTSGTWTTLIEGADINIGQFPRSVELLEADTEVGETTLASGTILLSLNHDDTVGNNSIPVLRQDIFALDVSKTEWDQAASVANATLIVDGSDIGITTDDERFHGLSLIPASVNLAPTITSNGGGANAAINVAENSTAVTTVTATDADLPAQTLTYSITGGADAARFAINSGSGVLTFVSAPDFEAPSDVGTDNVYDVQVTVSDGAGGTDVQNLAVTVTDAYVLDQFNAISYSGNDGTVDWSADWTESDSGGASGGDVRVLGSQELRIATESNGRQITRQADLSGSTTASLTLDVNNSLFGSGRVVLEARTGSSAWTNLATFTSGSASGSLGPLDLTSFIAADTQIRFRVTAEEGGATIRFDNVRIDFDVAGSNTAPVITSNGGGANAAINVAENSTAVTTVTATDADLPAQTLTYTISGGADAARFAINSSSGALTFVSAPDFEAPADVGADNVYDVQVQVSDGAGGTDVQDIAVTVTPVNDNNPVITSNGGGATAAINVAENSNAVATVTATDADLPAQTLSYSITGGADAARFAINSSSGALTFVSAPDFEAPSDVGTDNVYDVQVTVSDGAGGTDVQDIAVTVTDVGLLAYESFSYGAGNLQGANGGTGWATAWNLAAGSTAVVDATGLDDPTGLLPTAGGTAEMNTSTQFEQTRELTQTLGTPGSTAWFSFLLKPDSIVSGGMSLRLGDLAGPDDYVTIGTAGNDFLITRNASAFGAPRINNVVVSGQTYLLTARVDFAAGADTVTLYVDPTPGLASPDSPGPMIAQLTTADLGTLSTVGMIGGFTGNNAQFDEIRVGETFLDVAPAAANTPPTITSNGGGASAAANVAENSTAVTTMTASDPEAPPQTLTWSITGGADAARFAINSTTGALTFVAAPDFEAPTDANTDNVYHVTVQVSDGFGGTDAQNVSVTVTAANDNSPVITSNGGGATAAMNVVENSTAVTTVTATDADLPAQTLSYSISGGADAARFAINSTTGALTFVAALNFEAPTDAGSDNIYDVQVTVSDGAGGTDVQDIAVTVTDQNEFAVSAISDANAAVNQISEVTTNGSTVGITAAAVDNDGSTNAITFSLDDNAGGRFAINGSTGIVTVSNAALLDYEAATSHSITIRATSADGSFSTQNYSVAVLPVDDEAPVFTSPASVNHPENNPNVLTLTATDADDPATVITFTIVGGDDAARFNITGSDGLKLAPPRDFESPTDANGDNVYEVSIQASDGAGNVTVQNLAVTILNVNELPNITSNGAGATAGVNVVEGTTSVTVVTATDPDLPPQTMSYAITGGADAARFAINGGTGSLNFIAPPSHDSPTDADTDNVYQVTVQVSDGAGGTDTQSIAVTVVPSNFAPVGAVTISGTAAQNETLTAGHTLTDADGMGTISWQWRRNGVDIAGATASTYLLAEADVGTLMTVTASYTDGGGTNESVASSAVGPVANVNDVPTGSVTISGIAAEDQMLTASESLADADGMGVISWQWLRDGSAIAGATGTNYTLTDADVGTMISVAASWVDGHGTNEQVISSAVGSVANLNDVPTGVVSISGLAIEDQTLTASNSLADADGLGVIGYQWLRNGSVITGATGTTYTLGDADVGQLISVQASWVDGHGTAESVSSSAIGPVANVNDAPVVAPLSGITIDEDLAIGAVIAVATATDADAGDTLTWSITDGNDDGHFAIAADGSLVLVGPLNYLETSEYRLTVTATDNGTPALDGSTTLVVNLKRVVVPAPETESRPAEEKKKESSEDEAVETPVAPLASGSLAGEAPTASATGASNAGAAPEQQAAALVAPPAMVAVEDSGPIFVMPEISTHLADVVEARYSTGSSDFRRDVADNQVPKTSVPGYEVTFRSTELNQSLAQMKTELKATSTTQYFTAATAVTTTSSLTVGYVLWAIRGGWLASSILAQMPAWRLIDPLVVLSSLDGAAGAADDQSLQDMLEDGVREVESDENA